MIPLVDGNENVALLHPVLRARVAALCADPRLRGTLKVESAVRTYAEQQYLHYGWVNRLPGFNLAADPDRPITPAYGLSHARGSWHMEQPDGHGYAVDFNFSALPHDVQLTLEDVAREYRLIRTVPGEPWHYQMSWTDWTWTPEEADMPLTDDDLARIERRVRAVVQHELGGTNAKIYALAQSVTDLASFVRAKVAGRTLLREAVIRLRSLTPGQNVDLD